MSGSKPFAEGAILRFFNRRRILGVFAGLVLAFLAIAGVIVAYLNSVDFSERARDYVVNEIEQRIGAKATLRDFSWSFWQQRIQMQDLTLRGLEPADHPALAHFSRIDVGLNFRT